MVYVKGGKVCDYVATRGKTGAAVCSVIDLLFRKFFPIPMSSNVLPIFIFQKA